MRHSARLEAKGVPNLSAANETADDVHTPPLISPPGTKTPPTDPAKRSERAEQKSKQLHHARSGSLDVTAVSDMLQQEASRRQREATPGESPKRKRPRIYGDRYVQWQVNGNQMAKYTDMRCLDLYRHGLDKIFMQATHFCMKMAHPPLLRGRTRKRCLTSYTPKRVSGYVLCGRVMC